MNIDPISPLWVPLPRFLNRNRAHDKIPVRTQRYIYIYIWIYRLVNRMLGWLGSTAFGDRAVNHKFFFRVLTHCNASHKTFTSTSRDLDLLNVKFFGFIASATLSGFHETATGTFELLTEKGRALSRNWQGGTLRNERISIMARGWNPEKISSSWLTRFQFNTKCDGAQYNIDDLSKVTIDLYTTEY